MNHPADTLPERCTLSPPRGSLAPTAANGHPGHRWIILAPTLLTLGNMASGCFALLMAGDHALGAAALAILAGNVFDVFDGAIARWTGTTSRFGVVLDSFADAVSFCIAPAFLIYEAFLSQGGGRWEITVVFLFAACGVFRLVRFTYNSLAGGNGTYGDFTGLPVPAAGGIIAVTVYLLVTYDGTFPFLPLTRASEIVETMLLALLPILSWLMLSKYSYYRRRQSHRSPPRLRLVFVPSLAFLTIIVCPLGGYVVFLAYLGYIIGGPIVHLRRGGGERSR